MPQFTVISDSVSAHDSIYKMPDSPLFRFEAFFSKKTDSTAAADTINRTFLTESSSVKIIPKIRNTSSNVDNSSLIILSLVLILIVLSKHIFPRRFHQLWQAMAGETKLNLMLREWNPATSMPGAVFFFTYALLLSKFLQLLTHYFLAPEKAFFKLQFYFQILALTFAIILLRLVIKKFVAQLFKMNEINHRYNANEFSFYLIATIVLFVAVLAMLFQQTSTTFYLSIAAFITLLIYNLLRSFFIGLAHARFSVLYLFLYLCTLEIVPFLLLLKTVSILVSGQFSLF